MARQPQPQRITLGGREAVALTPEEYERLLTSRRQIGGQSARVRVLGQQVKRGEELLRELETLVGTAADGCPELFDDPGPGHTASCRSAEAGADGTDTDCLRCAIADLLRRHRDPAS